MKIVIPNNMTNDESKLVAAVVCSERSLDLAKAKLAVDRAQVIAYYNKRNKIIEFS